MKHLKPLRQYYDRFGVLPSVTTAFITDTNSEHLIKALRDAMHEGVPLTHEQEKEIERRTFNDYYTRREGGETILL